MDGRLPKEMVKKGITALLNMTLSCVTVLTKCQRPCGLAPFNFLSPAQSLTLLLPFSSVPLFHSLFTRLSFLSLWTRLCLLHSFSLSLFLHSVRQIIPPVSTLQPCFIYSTRLSQVCIIHTVYIYTQTRHFPTHTSKRDTLTRPVTVCFSEMPTVIHTKMHANICAHMQAATHRIRVLL